MEFTHPLLNKRVFRQNLHYSPPAFGRAFFSKCAALEPTETNASLRADISSNGLQVLGDIVVPFEQIGHLPVVAHQVIAKVYRTAAHFKGVD